MALTKITNWAFPVGDKQLSTKALYEKLAAAKSGFYPLGENRQWHGGIHIDQSVMEALQLANHSVKSMATGEIIAYRINDNYPKQSYNNKEVSFYSTGFTLVRHLLQMDYVAKQVAPNTQCEVITDKELVRGLNIRSEPSARGKAKTVLAVIPTGAKVELGCSEKVGNWYPVKSILAGHKSSSTLSKQKLKNSIEKEKETTKEAYLGWISIHADNQKNIIDDKYTIITDEDSLAIGAAVRQATDDSKNAKGAHNIVSTITKGSVVSIGKFDDTGEWAEITVKVDNVDDTHYATIDNISGWIKVSHLKPHPEPSAEQKKPKQLYLYSLYMHLADYAFYEANPKADKPAFWDEQVFKVEDKSGANKLDTIEGMKVYAEPDSKTVLSVLQSQTKLTLDKTAVYTGKEETLWYPITALNKGYHSFPELKAKAYKFTSSANKNEQNITILGWLKFSKSEAQPSGATYTIDITKKETHAVSKGLRIRAKKSGDTHNYIAMLEQGALVKLEKAEDTGRVKIKEIIKGKTTLPIRPDVERWVHKGSLTQVSSPIKFNEVVVLDKALPISAGGIVGQIGHYQTIYDAIELTANQSIDTIDTLPADKFRPELHVELFTCEDLPQFIKATQEAAKEITEKDKPLLLVEEGAKLLNITVADKADELKSGEDICLIDKYKPQCWQKVKVCYYAKISLSESGLALKDTTKALALSGKDKLKTQLTTKTTLTAAELPDSVTVVNYCSATATTTDKKVAEADSQAYTDIEVQIIPKTPREVWIASSQIDEQSGRRKASNSAIDSWKAFPLALTTPSDMEVGYSRTLLQSDLDKLDTVDKAQDDKGNSYYRLTFGSKTYQELTGWVCSKQEKVKRVSPWEWHGFEQVIEQSTAADFDKTVSDNQKQLADKDDYEQIAVLKSLGDILQSLHPQEADLSVILDTKHLKKALTHPWLAEKIAQLLVKYESEWYSEIDAKGKMPKWESLGEGRVNDLRLLQTIFNENDEQCKADYKQCLIDEKGMEPSRAQSVISGLDKLQSEPEKLQAIKAQIDEALAKWEITKTQIKSLLWWSEVDKKLKEQKAAAEKAAQEAAKNSEEAKTKADSTENKTASENPTETISYPELNTTGQAWYMHPVGMMKNFGTSMLFKKGDRHELIREINIRLAGFGGNVPTEEFTERTELMIKQFQRDYMNVEETGVIGMQELEAIDQFSLEYDLPPEIWDKKTNDSEQIFCPCSKCDGFGKKRNKGLFYGIKNESTHRYEYPGIHRSLLWALKAVIFYLEKENLQYSFRTISSGYRCYDRNLQKGRQTTNHKGKALDLHFNKNGKRTRLCSDMDEIRRKIFNKYLGARWDWKQGQQNIFNLESAAIGARSWVHYDVREFAQQYLLDQYFCKNAEQLNGAFLKVLLKGI